ncbi:hypothetical protein AAE478_005985 [Parahypoxylon ruwenzoriense]
MAALFQIPMSFPRVPMLTGKDALEEWKASIHERLGHFKLEKFIEGHVQAPKDESARHKFEKDRMFVSNLITSSIGNEVIGQLLDAGRVPALTTDPKGLWDFLINEVSGLSTPELFYELMEVKLEPGVSIKTFHYRACSLAARLYRRGVDLPSKSVILLLMKGFKERYPQWTAYLETEFMRGALDWDSFEQEVNAKADLEGESDRGTPPVTPPAAVTAAVAVTAAAAATDMEKEVPKSHAEKTPESENDRGIAPPPAVEKKERKGTKGTKEEVSKPNNHRTVAPRTNGKGGKGNKTEKPSVKDTQTKAAPGPTTNALTTNRTRNRMQVPLMNCVLCRRRHPVAWPICSGCSQHHPGGQARCYTLYPELRHKTRPQNASKGSRE